MMTGGGERPRCFGSIRSMSVTSFLNFGQEKRRSLLNVLTKKGVPFLRYSFTHIFYYFISLLLRLIEFGNIISISFSEKVCSSSFFKAFCASA